jgi:hypothetical protein
LQELQSHFDSVRELFLREETLLKENEEVDLRSYYQQVKSLWGEAQSHSEQPVIQQLNMDDYRSYSSRIDTLYRHDYENGCEINVWEVSGLKHDEVRNTAVLAWWLDKSESHGLGSRLLKQIITDHLNADDQVTMKACDKNTYQVRCESLPLRELENRIDIEIVTDTILMFWEVKINAPEGKGGQQLVTYKDLLSRKAGTIATNQQSYLIYLTKQKADLKSGVHSLTWSEVRESFLTVHRKLMSGKKENFNTKLLYQYCQFIERFK